MALSAGTRLGPYEILVPLGAGGMGEVYRARDTRLGREVAVKVLPAAFSADPDRLRRFEQEAQAASALNHPNILTIYDVGTHDAAPYVVSEFLDGETLRERLAGAMLPVRKAIDYGIQIAEGLAAAHEKGIVHRDLKPENLFVTKGGRVKILDFGLAKLTRPETGSGPLTEVPTLTAGTEPGVVMGTVGYMSPEQVRGQRADPRSDIFAFGAILYEMLSGKRAFRGDSAVETMNAILKEDVPAFPRISLDLPEGVERIVRRCLEKSPEERFQSARDLAFALGETSSRSEASRATPLASASRPRRAVWFVAAGLVAVVLAIGWGLGGWRERLFGAAKPGRIDSLAVLPLENLSRDAEQEYFADGMTEALITNLARIGALRVSSRTSIMRYKGGRKPLDEIARELGVDAVVEGSVLRSEGRVRITAQLIHAATDKHLWAEDYERDLRDVLTLQSEVARAIAREIEIHVTPQEEMRLTSARRVNPEAYEAYLQGRHFWNKRSEESLKRALAHFERAIEKDPAYAPAYAGLADSYNLLARYGSMPPREAISRGKAAATKALELDDSLAEAHASLGYAKLVYDWDWAGFERPARRAIELNPRYAMAHLWYAGGLMASGRLEEAAREVKLAHELEPLMMIINVNVGRIVYYYPRQYDRAIEQYRKAIELDPNFAESYIWLGKAYERKSRYAEAIAAFQKAVALRAASVDKGALGHALAVAGRRDEAQQVLNELKALSKKQYVSSYDIAFIYMGLGDHDLAFEWLQKACEERHPLLIFLRVEPQFDPIRSDPRFADLLRRVGLPP